MRERLFVHVAGLRGAGKTAFIQAMISRLGGAVLCIRGVADSALRDCEINEAADLPELAAYRQAGASAAVLYRFPCDPSAMANLAEDDFFTADFMQDYATAVVIEGDAPTDSLDFRVFVAPVGSDATFLHRQTREHAAAHAAALDGWEAALASPETFAQYMADFMDLPGLSAVALKQADILEKTRAAAATTLDRLRATPPPKPTQHWALTPGYVGIERAQLVVGNAHGKASGARAEAFLKDVARLRGDAAVFKDVLGLRGTKTPITAVVANVVDPLDKNLKKALARVHRAAAKLA